MRRRLVLGSVAAIAVAMAAQLGAGQAEPLPTLRNGPEWRASTATMSAADLAWLERGIVPGGPEHRDLVAQALLDLRGLTQPTGAVAAGPDGPWAYAWPRDNSFVAVAYAVSGHPDDAWRTLRFFVDVQLEDGGFEARYRLDGSGAPDERQRQTDGAGWLLWAIDAVSAASGQPVPADLRPLRDRATEHLLRLTAGGRELLRHHPTTGRSRSVGSRSVPSHRSPQVWRLPRGAMPQREIRRDRPAPPEPRRRSGPSFASTSPPPTSGMVTGVASTPRRR